MHFQLSAKLCKIVNFETQNYANNCKIYQQIKSKLEFLKDVDKVDSPGLIVSLRLSVVLSALKRNHLRFEFQFPHSKLIRDMRDGLSGGGQLPAQFLANQVTLSATHPSLGNNLCR